MQPRPSLKKPRSAPPPPESPADAAAGEILVIDDEPVIRSVLERVLRQGHSVTLPASSPEALALIESGRRFDVILCDLMMPELTGIDLHERLLASHPDQARRMVFMTGGAFTVRTLEFLRTVPNRRLEKPFDVVQLRRLVGEMLAAYGPALPADRPA